MPSEMRFPANTHTHTHTHTRTPTQVDVVRAYGGYWASDYAVYFRKPDVPVVVSVHDTNPRLLHKSLMGADYVWSVSGAVSTALLEKGLEPHRLFSFTNRVDVAQFGSPVPEEVCLCLCLCVSLFLSL